MKIIFILLTFILSFTANAGYTDPDEGGGGGGGGGGVAGVSSFKGRTGDVTPAFGDYSAGIVSNVPALNIEAATVQAAINELDLEKFPYTGGTIIGLTQVNAELTIGQTGSLAFFDGAGNHKIFIQAPADITTDYTLTLPLTDGLVDQVLSTNGSGILSWTNLPDPNIVIDADGDTQIQVEETTDEDTIRFDTVGEERMVINSAGSVGIGTTTPNTNAILDVSSTTKGVLIPRMTTAERTGIAGGTPADSLIVYDTQLKDYFFYDSLAGSWKPLYTLQDVDGDTGIVFDETLVDQDAIIFSTLGTEKLRVTANGNIGVGTNSPDASTLIDMSSVTKGIRFPSMTTAQRLAIVSPATGLFVYDTDFSKFYYWSGSTWFSLDNGIGHGVLGPYSFNFTATNITAAADIPINFQRINTTTGRVENALTVIPINTVIATGTGIGAGQTAYVSARYDWVTKSITYIPNANPNNVDIGKEILLAGPYTNLSSQITGYVKFYHYATDTTVGWSDDLADVERARVISGIQHSLISPDINGNNYHVSLGQGVTFNSLLRDPAGHISTFFAKNTLTTDDVYKYKPDQVEYDYYPAGTFGFQAGQYWNPTLNGGLGGYDVTGNNQFTVTAFFVFPGDLGNQFVGILVDDTDYSSIDDARNAIFTGQALDGRPAGLDSAALVGYLILRGPSLSTHDYGNPAVEGQTWEFIGPRDSISITATASGSAVPLNDLSDVDLVSTAPLVGQFLAYDPDLGQWVPGPLQKPGVGGLSPALGSLIYNTSTNLLNMWNGTTWLSIPSGGGDATAIHVDTANEIFNIAGKTLPIGSDVLVIEDSADSYNKKSILIQSIDHDSLLNFQQNEHIDWTVDQGGTLINSANYISGGDGSDGTAIHDNLSGEIATIAAKTNPVGNDFLLIEDSQDTNFKKSVTITNLSKAVDHDQLFNFVANEHLDWTQAGVGTIDVSNYIEGGPGTDTTAFHSDVSGEINSLITKQTPLTSDIVLIEDSADSFNKKYTTVGDIVALASGGGAISRIQDADNNTYIDTEEATDEIRMQLGTAVGLYKHNFIKSGMDYSWNNGTDSALFSYDVSTNLLLIKSSIGATQALDSSGIRMFGGANANNFITLKVPELLSANYQVTFPTAGPTEAGQVLSTDLNGNLSWTTVSGGGGGGSRINDQDNNTFVETGVSDEIVSRAGPSGPLLTLRPTGSLEIKPTTGGTVAYGIGDADGSDLVYLATAATMNSTYQLNFPASSPSTTPIIPNSYGQGVKVIGYNSSGTATGNWYNVAPSRLFTRNDTGFLEAQSNTDGPIYAFGSNQVGGGEASIRLHNQDGGNQTSGNYVGIRSPEIMSFGSYEVVLPDTAPSTAGQVLTVKSLDGAGAGKDTLEWKTPDAGSGVHGQGQKMGCFNTGTMASGGTYKTYTYTTPFPGGVGIVNLQIHQKESNDNTFTVEVKNTTQSSFNFRLVNLNGSYHTNAETICFTATQINCGSATTALSNNPCELSDH